MNLLIGAATIGLLLAPLALGIFVSYRVYHTLDLTADGAFGTGAAAAAALLVQGVPPVAATLAGVLAGVAAGIVTGVLHTGLGVGTLLAGVLTSTALYSASLFLMGGGNLSLTSAETVMTLAGRAGRHLGLPVQVVLGGTRVSGDRIAELVLMAAIAAVLAVALALFLRTDLGLAVRAAGSSPRMATAFGVNVKRMIVLGLGLANGLVALAGALLAQYEGFANIQMGIGAVVMGVAMLMVGETLVGRHPLHRWIAGAVAGALMFRLLIAGAIRAGLPPDALKLVTAVFVLGVLVLPRIGRRMRAGAEAAATGHG